MADNTLPGASEANFLNGLEALLAERIEQSSVPGASLAVFHGGGEYVASAGVANLDTGAPVTQDTVFQIGSITKPMTATLALKLVEDGALGLDEPVTDHIPNFRLKDMAAARAITLRHLLTHSSGIDGDLFIGLPEGETLSERYVEQMASLGQLHGVGREFSYCNAGYVVVGRLIEIVTGESWAKAIRSRLFAPLGMDSASAVQGEYLSDAPAAVGHVAARDGEWHVQPVPFALPASGGPMGTTVTMTARDLIRFACFHTCSSDDADTENILSRKFRQLMQEQQIALPEYAYASTCAWGLGWAIYDWGGNKLFGHDGDTIGQLSFLRIDPNTATVVAVLTNGGPAIPFAMGIIDTIFDNLAGVRPPGDRLPADDRTVKPEAYVGRYKRLGRDIEIAASADCLMVTLTDDDVSQVVSSPPLAMERIDRHVFRCSTPSKSAPMYFQFGDFKNDGCAAQVFAGYRLAIRND